MANPALIVMAAGIGSRYGGLKQIDQVGPSGEKILDYSVYDARRAGFDRVVFVIRKEIEADFREHIGRTIEAQMDTAYVHQELDRLPPGFSVPEGRAKPWGTAHAVAVCREAVRTPFAVINADDFYGASSFRLLSDYLGAAEDRAGVHDFCLVGYVLANTLSEHGHVARGVCEATEDGFLRAIEERTRIQRFGDAVRYSEDDGRTWTDLPAESLVSMNMWGFTPGLFGELETGFTAFLEERGSDLKAEFFLPDIVGRLIDEGRARAKILPSGERWFGVTYQEDRPTVERAVRGLVARGVYPERLWP